MFTLLAHPQLLKAQRLQCTYIVLSQHPFFISCHFHDTVNSECSCDPGLSIILFQVIGVSPK